MKPQKVRILDTKYTEKSNLVEWKVQFETGNQLVLAIPGEELGFLLGFDFVFTPELIFQACNEFKGKEKFLVLCPEDITSPEMVNRDVDDKTIGDKEISERDVGALDKKLKDYPFDRVVKNIYEGNIENIRIGFLEDANHSLKDFECKVQITKKDNIILPQKFQFIGMWKHVSAKSISGGKIDDIFSIISAIASKYGLVAERPYDFGNGFFSLRPMV